MERLAKSVAARCRGPFRRMVKEAVERSRAAGFQAVRPEDGVAEWRAGGLPVAV